MSDDISMGALSGTLAERSRAALAAGCDLVLHCNGRLDEMREVAGRLPQLAGRCAAARRCALWPCGTHTTTSTSRRRAHVSPPDDRKPPERSLDDRRDHALRDRDWPSARTDEPALVVDVEGFEGPLDLLLTLARQQKVDLAKISILALADQYLAFIEEARKLRLELAADYLVMAAWLAYLKSRLLLPERNPAEGQSAEDMASALAFRLKRLEAFREVAQKLMDGRSSARLFSRGDPEPIADIKHPQWTATLYDLLSAYARQRQKSALGQRALQAAHRLVARGGARGAGAADRRRPTTGAGSTSILIDISGRAVDARDRDGVELCGDAGTGARGRDGVASACGLRADLSAQARRRSRKWRGAQRRRREAVKE